MAGSSNRPPRSAKEWRLLPELPMKAIADEGEKGSVYRVLKAGFYSARYAELDDAGVNRPDGDGVLPLPTVTVEEEGGPRLYRLPDKLNGWAYDNVAIGVSGVRLFPCDVEFGVLHGRPYAEFVVPPAKTLN